MLVADTASMSMNVSRSSTSGFCAYPGTTTAHIARTSNAFFIDPPYIRLSRTYLTQSPRSTQSRELNLKPKQQVLTSAACHERTHAEPAEHAEHDEVKTGQETDNGARRIRRSKTTVKKIQREPSSLRVFAPSTFGIFAALISLSSTVFGLFDASRKP